MSPEPEKPVEKLLREHAETRRAETEALPPLHGATRRMLQAEVARTYGAAAPASGSPAGRPWWAYWPFALFASCCVLLLAVLVDFGQEQAEFASADQTRPQTAELAPMSPQPAASSLPAATPLPGEPFPPAPGVRNPEPARLADARQEERTMALELRQQTAESLVARKPESKKDAFLAGDLSPATAPADQPALRPAPAPVLTAPAASGRAAGGEEAELASKRKLARDALATSATTASLDTASAAKAEEKPQTATGAVFFANTVMDSPVNPHARNFTQAPARAQLRRNYQSPPVPAVMETFQVQQTGDEVKIIDGDGSIYTGSLLAAIPENERVTTTDKDVSRPAEAAGERGRGVTPQISMGGMRAPSPASRAFRATGLNRTLNQPIVIDGTIAETRLADERQNFRESPKAAVAKENAPVLPPIQIQGRVQIGDRQEIIINAVPVNR